MYASTCLSIRDSSHSLDGHLRNDYCSCNISCHGMIILYCRNSGTGYYQRQVVNESHHNAQYHLDMGHYNTQYNTNIITCYWPSIYYSNVNMRVSNIKINTASLEWSNAVTVIFKFVKMAIHFPCIG